MVERVKSLIDATDFAARSRPVAPVKTTHPCDLPDPSPALAAGSLKACWARQKKKVPVPAIIAAPAAGSA